MPAPVDLAGRRFGQLVVLAREPGAGPTRWLCRCECGADTSVEVRRLSSVADDNPRAVRACERCRSRPCTVCGTLFLTPGSTTTCGAEACRLANRRAVNRQAQLRAELRDPGLSARRQRERIARIRAVPLLLEALREQQHQHARGRRRRFTPEQRAAAQETRRERYGRNRAQARAYYDAWLAAMPPERRAQWDEAIRAAGRRRQHRVALARLMAEATTLLERSRRDG